MQSEKRKEYMKQYKLTHKEQQAIYFKRWYEKGGRKRSPNFYSEVIMLYQKANPEKHRAGVKVYEAIKAGKLTKPAQCIICNKERYLNAHHQDYAKPLEVLWLCASCHKKLHLGIIAI